MQNVDLHVFRYFGTPVRGTFQTRRSCLSMSVRRGIAENICSQLVFRILTQTGPSESVATLDRGPRLEDHVTLSELGRIDEAF